MQLLARKGVGLPVTVFAHKTSRSEEVIDMAGGTPVIIKLLEGTQGIGVVLGETEKAAESIIQAFGGANINILIQQFIKEAGGMDVRCFVIGDKVVASMLRKGQEGDFRSNLHRGGTWPRQPRLPLSNAKPPSWQQKPWGLRYAVSTCFAPMMVRS